MLNILTISTLVFLVVAVLNVPVLWILTPVHTHTNFTYNMILAYSNLIFGLPVLWYMWPGSQEISYCDPAVIVLVVMVCSYFMHLSETKNGLEGVVGYRNLSWDFLMADRIMSYVVGAYILTFGFPVYAAIGTIALRIGEIVPDFGHTIWHLIWHALVFYQLYVSLR